MDTENDARMIVVVAELDADDGSDDDDEMEEMKHVLAYCSVIGWRYCRMDSWR